MDVLWKILSLLTEPWVLLCLAAALGYTLVEFIDEYLLEKMRSKVKGAESEVSAVGTLTLFSGFFGVMISLGFMSYAQVTDSLTILQLDPSQMWQAMGVGALEVLWMVPYLHAVQRGGAINAAPLFQLIPVFSLLLGLLVFGEVPEDWQIVGGLTIAAGGFLLNCKRGTFKLDIHTISLMSAASLMISLGYFLFKDAVENSNFIATSFWSGIGMFVMSVGVWWGYPPYRRQFNAFVREKNLWVIIWQTVNELVNSAAVIASHVAVVIAPSIMLATSLNAAHPIFILIFGFGLKLFGSEKHGDALDQGGVTKITMAILLIAIGTAVIAVE